MYNALTQTDFTFANQRAVYKGKVRDVYSIGEDLLVMISTDRLSAFDVILPQGIPYKGQILNQMATEFLNQTRDIVPNWILDSPDPNVAVGHRCEPFKVEMVIRGYLSGHAYREYQQSKRTLCGVTLPDGLKENDRFKYPIITPTTKALQGNHDQDISKQEILAQGIVSEKDYQVLEDYTYALFERGSQIAKKRGLLLVDTKYEFGKTRNGEIVLIDEIHTPDSSRYFYSQEYEQRQEQGLPQHQLSKEFVRQWLISKGFQGKQGQEIPLMPLAFVQEVSQRYVELYEQIIGKSFVAPTQENITERIFNNVSAYLKQF